ncbi:hypothetical protein LguiA_006322 [Lonicera macranthoides]
MRKDEKEDLEDLLGNSFIERTEKMGRVVKGWVKREVILAHPSIGGFMSHSGWNSVMEAASKGVPLLAWPQKVLKKAGLGVWVGGWVWRVIDEGRRDRRENHRDDGR